MTRIRWSPRLGVLLVLATASTSHAQLPPSVRLVYSRGVGASACPDEQTLRNEVSGRLGYEPFAPGAARTVIARITREGRGLRGDVELLKAEGGTAGSRRLVSQQNDCAELAATMALAISIAIDPLLLTRRAPPSPPPPPVRPPSPEVAPTAAPVAASAPRPILPSVATVDPIELRAGVGVLGSLGAAPAPSLGVTVELSARRRSASLTLEGRWDIPASATTSGTGGVKTSIAGASLLPCLHYRFVAGCAVVLLGALHAVGVSVDRPRDSTTFYAAAGARVALEFPLWQTLVARVHADLLAPLTPTSLQIDGTATWATPPVSVSLGTGLAILLP